MLMGRTHKIPVRAFLMHITHYDPKWFREKPREKPFDLKLGLEVIDELAKHKFNTLIIDCEDGVIFKSHPELARHYSVPMGVLKRLVLRAHSYGMDVIPKTNFSRSRIHKHNHWMNPHSSRHFDTPQYWETAFELIDELIKVCRPKRFYHIGMDEDHDRTFHQYFNAILTLHEGLRKRGLRPVIWNDTAHGGIALIHARKSRAAERVIPHDVVQVVWDYSRPQGKIVKRLVDAGFDVWGAPGWPQAKKARLWREALKSHGGKGRGGYSLPRSIVTNGWRLSIPQGRNMGNRGE
jgi:hypothetical protein